MNHHRRENFKSHTVALLFIIRGVNCKPCVFSQSNMVTSNWAVCFFTKQHGDF